MYSKTTREQNIIRLDLAKKLGYEPYDTQQEEFFIKSASFKHGFWDRRCHKTYTLIYDALTYAIAVPHSQQLFACKKHEMQRMAGEIMYDIGKKWNISSTVWSPGSMTVTIGTSDIYMVGHNTERWLGRDVDRMLIDDSDNITLAQLGAAHATLVPTNGDLIMM
jgi:tRNA(Met) C34 N-acetyltransferase TmcA